MTTKAHWEAIYHKKAPDEVTWYRPHLETSVQLIQQAAPSRDAAIIDVGGGESTLVDDLLALGYRHVNVLDISHEAIQTTRQRLGTEADHVAWFVDDITQAALPEQHYAVWHDRAVFHFLVEPEQRAAYVQQLLDSLTAGGHVVMAVFGQEGPQQCSGLDVVRHDIAQLSEHLGSQFEPISHCLEAHCTPGGNTQQFLYAHFRLKGNEPE